MGENKKKMRVGNQVLVSILLKFPITVVQGADLTGLEPSGDTVEMESVVTHSPSNGAFIGGHGSLIGLAFNAKIHNVVPANGAIVDDNIPGP